jgi:hypothetical protein
MHARPKFIELEVLLRMQEKARVLQLPRVTAQDSDMETAAKGDGC